MKFGAEYGEALRNQEYPAQWIESALSYKKLKKCIKRVREELLALGLDHETLEALWQHVGASSSYDSNHDNNERLMHYDFTSENGARFVPKLTIALDPADGSPMEAWLSPETKRVLRKVGRNKQRRESRQHSAISAASTTNHRPSCITIQDVESDNSENDTGAHTPEEQLRDRMESTISTATSAIEPDADFETIEIPLNSDSEFFQILKKELQALERLQDQEQVEITSEINSLSKELIALRGSGSKRAKAEINTWREIFRLYIESDIFLSPHEHDAGVRPIDKAAKLYQAFVKQVGGLNTNPPKPKSKEAHIALDRFLAINTTLLNLLGFQELNRKAFGKILKKFDKQTSLHAIANTTPEQVMKSLTLHPNKPAVSPRELARSTAFAISSSLLSIIPQLDDYLCPICCMVTYKPIRLRCAHVFCIRCMIRLQRDKKDECPLCREKVVLEATEDNLDKKLQKFLKEEFPNDVAEKRKENELAAGKELFGEDYEGTHKCSVM